MDATEAAAARRVIAGQKPEGFAGRGTRFRRGEGGNSPAVLAAALALVVVGILFLFVIPWAGLVVGPIVLAAGVVLAVVYLLRRPARRVS